MFSDLDGRRLKLLLVHETPAALKRSSKEQDVRRLGAALAQMGHEATLLNASQARSLTERPDDFRTPDGAMFDLASFDGALFRVASRTPWLAACQCLFIDRGVFIYQDVETTRAAGNKLNSLATFVANDIPTPRTLGFPFERPVPAADLRRFLETIHSRPYVVKRSHGWAGNFVRFPEDAAQAERLVWEWHAKNVADKRGGVLAQEFIESGQDQKCDYRVQTVVGRDAEGRLVAQIAGAVLRVAPARELMAHLCHGAERRRMSLDFDEGERFYRERRGLTAADYRERVETGAISLLPSSVAALALRTAEAFGLGCLGLDIVVRASDGQPFVLEANPFASTNPELADEEGFPIYARWAAGFAQTVAFEKARRR